MRKITCGILIRVGDKILLGHSTGNTHWDIPKGLLDETETVKEAALRETREETGLDLSNKKLKDLGLFRLNSAKDIHIFEVSLESVDLNSLYCESMVELPNRKPFPEIDDFKLFTKEESLLRVSKSLNKVLINLL
jgi:8-oxo-dGTP pyrophosphatase MutT (NUDIX family)